MVSDYGCHGRACTHSYLLALEQVMKTPELMGAGFFHFIQSFGENKKSSSKRIKNKTSKSHMKDLLLFLPPQKKVNHFVSNVSFLLHIRQHKSYKLHSEKVKVVQLYRNVLFWFFP